MENNLRWADESKALHWIDRYAAGIDADPQMDRILECVDAGRIEGAVMPGAKAIPEHLFMEMIAEMQRRMSEPKHINVSADGYEADGNPEWLPVDDTQVGVEFAVEYLNSRMPAAGKNIIGSGMGCHPKDEEMIDGLPSEPILTINLKGFFNAIRDSYLRGAQWASIEIDPNGVSREETMKRAEAAAHQYARYHASVQSVPPKLTKEEISELRDILGDALKAQKSGIDQ